MVVRRVRPIFLTFLNALKASGGGLFRFGGVKCQPQKQVARHTGRTIFLFYKKFYIKKFYV